MTRAITFLLLLAALTLTNVRPGGAQTAASRPRVGAVAIRAFVFSVEDARAAQVTAALDSILKSEQTSPAAAYQAVRGAVNEQVRRKLARRDWQGDPEGIVGPDKPLVLDSISFPLPPLRKGKPKKGAPGYDASGTTRGRKLTVTPHVEEATGRANSVTLRYSITSLPNSAVFVRNTREARPEPTVIADLVPETTADLPASGGRLFTFKSSEEPGRTTVLIIIAASQL